MRPLDLLLLLLGRVTMAQLRPASIPSPTFFISLMPRCEFGGVSLDPGGTFEASGSLCAYAKEANVVYSCPAGDNYCWNTGSSCNGFSDTSAGSDEVACSDIGSGQVHWCCNRQFGNCTQTKFQQNNCWSWFDNPVRDINPLAASASASKAKQAAVTQPTLKNIIVSTLPAGGWAAQATEATPTSNRILSNTISNGGIGASSTSEPPGSTTRSNLLSNGAIAGIAIGALLFGMLVTAAGFIFWTRRKKRRGIVVREKKEPEIAQKVDNSYYEKSASPALQSQFFELPVDSQDIALETRRQPGTY